MAEPYDIAGLVDGGRVGGPSTAPRVQPVVGRLDAILAGLRRLFMPSPDRPTPREDLAVRARAAGQGLNVGRAGGVSEQLEQGYAPPETPWALPQQLPEFQVPEVPYGGRDVPGIAPAPPGRTDAALGAPAGTIGYEPPDDAFRGGLTAGTPPEDPDLALRDLGLEPFELD